MPEEITTIETSVETTPGTDAAVAEPGASTTPTETPKDGVTPPQESAGETIPKKRFDQIYGKMKTFERELADLKAGNAPPKPAVPAEPTEPKAEDFEDWDSYQKAMVDFRAEQIVDRKLRAAREAEATTQVENDFTAKLHQGRAKYHDFDEVALAEDIPYSKTMVDIVKSSPQAADIAYHLGQHPEEAARISALGPWDTAYEMKKIEREMAGGKVSPPKISNAPPPIKPVSGGESAGIINTDPDKMTMGEYRAQWRKAHGLSP